MRIKKSFVLPYIRKHKVGKGQLTRTCVVPAGEKQWHIFYLRPHAEKLVFKLLTNLGYQVFWPVTESVRIWKNRQKKKVRLPLFPGYLFVYTHAHELYSVIRLPRVVNYVACGGKPSILSDYEVEGIRRMLGMGKVITVEKRFFQGEQVRIVSGPLKGYEGILVSRHSKTRFGIQLSAISHTVLIDITRVDLEKL